MSNTDLFQLTLCLLGLAATALGAMGLWVLQDMATSVKALNLKMAEVYPEVKDHGKRINHLETRRH